MIDWGQECQDALDYFRKKLSQSPDVIEAISLIRASLYGLPGGSFCDDQLAIVSDWLGDTTYRVEEYDEETGSLVFFDYIYARNAKADLVGKEVAPYV